MKEKTKDDFTEKTVAVYWDFENIHASLFDSLYGESSYQQSRFAVQDNLVNLKAVMDYITGIGDVAINRAYANWQFFSRYRNDFNETGIDLIQIFSRGRNMKNGADIRLVLDVVEDINHYSHITHVVIVAGDSDYISLAQKVKQSGRVIIGIGVQEATNEYWVKSCNEFKYYQILLEKSDGTTKPRRPRSNIRNDEKLLMTAIKRLVAQKGENRVSKGHLKSVMRRLDPAFDETAYGFPTFSAFLDNFSDQVETLDHDSGGHVGLRPEIFQKEFSSLVVTSAELIAAV